MTVDLHTRVVFVTAGEAPPMEVVRTVDHPHGVAEGRELDSFLAELDAGQDVPNLLVAAGGSKVIELLRRHERTACLPIFLWGSSARVAPGWDGNVVRWDALQLAQASAWHKVLQMAHPVAELEEQQRREHHFFRYLASRGTAPIDAVAVFGIDVPEVAIARWQRDGWVTVVGDAVHSSADLVHKIAGDGHAQARADSLPKPVSDAVQTVSAAAAVTPEAAAVAATEEQVATVHADVVASLLEETAWRQRAAATALPVGIPERRFGKRDVVLLLMVGFVLVDLWGRYGAAYFQPGVTTEPPAVATAATNPATILELELAPQLPELTLDAHLRWEIVDYTAAFDGILEWRSNHSTEVRAGEVIAFLVQPQALAADTSKDLQLQLDRIYQQIGAQQQEANEAAAAATLHARQAHTQTQLQVEALVTRVALLQQSYDRSRKLAEDGVLSFREIRPDWDKLQAAKAELTDSQTQLASRTLELEEQLQQAIPEILEDPLWQAQIAAIELAQQQQPVSAFRIPVVAAESGFFVPRVPTASVCASGEVIGQLRKSGAGQVEAILATADWNSDYLQGVARLRRPQRSSWMPTRILAAESTPEGITILRLRLPVGWLDGGSGGSASASGVDNATQLELRITAPMSPVHEGR
jgi:hypothetical protein